MIEAGEPGADVGEDGDGIFPAPPFVDRSLLYEGDQFVSRFNREVMEGTDGSGPAGPDLLEKARDRYDRFLRKYPDKTAWVDWRKESMEFLRKKAIEEGRIPAK
jgi:hypothetical protein